MARLCPKKSAEETENKKPTRVGIGHSEHYSGRSNGTGNVAAPYNENEDQLLTLVWKRMTVREIPWIPRVNP